MLIEHNWRLSEAQAITADANSTNVVDLSSVRDLGEGTPLFLHVQVTTEFVGSTTLTIRGKVADDTGLSTNADEIIVSKALPLGALTLHSQFFFALGFYRRGEDYTIYAHDGSPQGTTANGRRYFGLTYDVGSDTNFTEGAVTCKLTLDASTTPRIYPASTST